MARPQPRPITRHPLTPPAAEPSAPSDATGQPDRAGAELSTAQPTSTGSAVGKRSGKQLGLRIPEPLYARLVAVAEDTGIPQTTLVRRLLDSGLRTYEH